MSRNRVPRFLQRRNAFPWVVSLVWILLLTVLTVNKLSRLALVADTSLFTTMSLQRVTLFYWGQNRLLNVIPALLSVVRDPGVNVEAFFIISALCFFGAVAALALVFHRFTPWAKDPLNRLVVVIVSTSVPVLVLKQSALANQAFMHPEYTLPVALACAALALVWWVRGWWTLPIAAALVAVALGVNPTISLPLFLVLGVPLIVSRQWHSRSTYFGILVAISLAAWTIISTLSSWANPGDGYLSPDFQDYPVHVEQALLGIGESFSSLRLLVVVIGGAVLAALIHFEKRTVTKRSVPISVIVIIFCTLWVLIFSANHWVVLNGVNVRYFAFVFLGLYFLVAMRLPSVVDIVRKRRWSRWFGGLTLLAVMTVTVALVWAPFTSLNAAPALQKAHQHARSDVALYAGEYWSVWMIVLDKELAHEPGYGLAFRGLSNKPGVLDFVKTSSGSGPVKVACIGGDVPLCQSQIKAFFGAEGQIKSVLGEDVLIDVPR